MPPKDYYDPGYLRFLFCVIISVWICSPRNKMNVNSCVCAVQSDRCLHCCRMMEWQQDAVSDLERQTRAVAVTVRFYVISNAHRHLAAYLRNEEARCRLAWEAWDWNAEVMVLEDGLKRRTMLNRACWLGDTAMVKLLLSIKYIDPSDPRHDLAPFIFSGFTEDNPDFQKWRILVHDLRVPLPSAELDVMIKTCLHQYRLGDLETLLTCCRPEIPDLVLNILATLEEFPGASRKRCHLHQFCYLGPTGRCSSAFALGRFAVNARMARLLREYATGPEAFWHRVSRRSECLLAKPHTVAEVYSVVLLFADGYSAIADDVQLSEARDSRPSRFLRLCARLPNELKASICHLTQKRTQASYVASRYLEPALKYTASAFARTCPIKAGRSTFFWKVSGEVAACLRRRVLKLLPMLTVVFLHALLLSMLPSVFPVK